VSQHQKGETHNQESKTSLDLLEQEIVSGSGISWAICKSAQTFSNAINTVFRPILQCNYRSSTSRVVISVIIIWVAGC